jgi:hypothetical protein
LACRLVGFDSFEDGTEASAFSLYASIPNAAGQRQKLRLKPLEGIVGHFSPPSS